MTQRNNEYMVLEYQKLFVAWLRNLEKAREALAQQKIPEFTRQMRLANGKRKQMDIMLNDVQNSIYY